MRRGPATSPEAARPQLADQPRSIPAVALFTLYYVVITAKLRRNGLHRDVGEANSSTAVQRDPGIS